MAERFPDHFSRAAGGYAAYRPSYPRDWLLALSSHAPARGLALDVGAGSGQAAGALEGAFARVIAVDASAAQLREGKGQRVRALAEALPFRAGSACLVMAAQALHWFEPSGFHREVARVLQPRGLFLAVGYGTPSVRASERIETAFAAFLAALQPHWPPQRAAVESRYRELEFPYDEVDVPGSTLVSTMPPAALVGYLGTWSALAPARAALRADPLGSLAKALAQDGDAGERLCVEWPLFARAGRRPG